jgi:AraC-like DNA-binding protein
MPDQSDICAGNRASTNIWDTEYCSAREAFTIFREGICSTFMPWSPERKSERPFVGRLEGFALDNGSIGHAQMTPIICARSKSNVAQSPTDGFYANFVLSGELMVEQAGHTNFARPGDLVVYDTSRPVVLTERASNQYEDIAILIPKSRFSTVGNVEDYFLNILLTRDELIAPLAACLTCLQRNAMTLTEVEWRALLDAIACLLPLAAGCFGNSLHQRSEKERTNEMLRRVRAFLDNNIASKELSPGLAASEFGCSSRYIHQLFAMTGTTFSAYVRGKRLDKVRADLLTPNCQNQPIQSIALRWGFSDLSGFNRAFKKRFGCSPRSIRLRFG